jgi:hypothetical protein
MLLPMCLYVSFVTALWALPPFQILRVLMHLQEVLITFCLIQKINYTTVNTALDFDYRVVLVDVQTQTIFAITYFAAVNALLGGEAALKSTSVHLKDMLVLLRLSVKVIRAQFVKVAFNCISVLLFDVSV